MEQAPNNDVDADVDKTNSLKDEDLRAAIWQALQFAVAKKVVTARQSGQYKEHQFHTDECIKSAYVSPKEKTSTPYTQISYNGIKYYMHRLAWRFGNKNAKIPSGLDVSHLCNEHKCFNPAHLTVELGAANRARGYCQSSAAKFSDYCCPHEPTCPGVPPCKQPK